MNHSLLTTCGFGLEAIVRQELADLGVEAEIVSPGFVRFVGSVETICLCNLWLRTADRVLLLVDNFQCSDFDQLFARAEQCPWEQWLKPFTAFPVTGHIAGQHHRSVQSAVKTVKRAIVNRLSQHYGLNEFPESEHPHDVHVALVNDQAWLTIDTTGKSLHRRGYRQNYRKTDLKETLAAAIVLLSKWDRDRPLIDPFCGLGTIPIEAAMIGCHIAPGRNRDFAAEQWGWIEEEVWESARREADEAQLDDLPHRIYAYDVNPNILRIARRCASDAGVEDSIHFQTAEFRHLETRRQHGCVVTNAPWFEATREVQELYQTIPEVLRKLPTWSHYILSDHPRLEEQLGKQADRRRKLYNDRMICTLYSYYGPRPGQADPSPSSPSDTEQEKKPRDRGAAFGQLTAKEYEQAELFARRLLKRARHLRRWPTQKGISCFRLYERDIPEIPLVVDRYHEALHITEYERPHDRDPATHANWLDLLAETAGKTLGIAKDRVFLKRRQRQSGDQQYTRLAEEQAECIVEEGGLKFSVNLSDYVDTGLFLDHRITRSMFRSEAAGKRVLNLFAYTGAFSVYAAAGGAAEVTTVDWTTAYLEWAKRNMHLNQFAGDPYQFIRSDAAQFLDNLPEEPLFDLAIVDPPTFSNSKRTTEIWEVQSGYISLLNALLKRMPAGAVIYFSNNFRRFKFDPSQIAASRIHEISNQTVPPDFRNRRIHRCWRMEK